MNKRRTVSFFLPPDGWMRRVFYFVLLLLILSLPFAVVHLFDLARTASSQGLTNARKAVRALSDWKEHAARGDLSRAEEDIDRAFRALSAAEHSLRGWGSGLLLLTSGPSVVSAGKDCVLLANLFTKLLEHTSVDGVFSHERALSDLPLVVGLFHDMKTTLEHLSLTLGSIQSDTLPKHTRSDFEMFRSSLHEISNVIGPLDTLASFLQYAGGYDSKRRFMIVFQNDGELRPTGGFAGSFALIDVDRGQIQKTEFPGGGSYDLQGQLRATIRAPRPLAPVNPRWEFQDANWFADFPASARKLAWFYEKSGGSSIDGVIAVNAALFEKYLALTGPIAMPEYQVTVTADSFFAETVRQVEERYDRSKNKPKQFLGDLIPRVLARLGEVSAADARSLIALLVSAAQRRDLQIYSFYSEQEKRIAALGLSGETRQTDADFLQIVDANIGANKSDRNMKMRVSQNVILFSDRPPEVTVRIERVNENKKAGAAPVLNNRSFLRFLVPAGSHLIASRGFLPMPASRPLADSTFDADVIASEGGLIPKGAHPMMQGTEAGKTVFGGIIETPLGQSAAAEIRYRLPFSSRTLSQNGYGLLVQRQSGSKISEYAVRIIPPNGAAIRWSHPSSASNRDTELVWRGPLDSDHTFGIRY